jgi:hypothetical protein
MIYIIRVLMCAHAVFDSMGVFVFCKEVRDANHTASLTL